MIDLKERYERLVEAGICPRCTVRPRARFRVCCAVCSRVRTNGSRRPDPDGRQRCSRCDVLGHKRNRCPLLAQISADPRAADRLADEVLP